MTDLHKRIEELVQELHDNVENNWQAMEGPDLVDVEPEGWLRKSLTTLFKEELEALAFEIEKVDYFWMGAGQENPTMVKLEDVLAVFRSKAARI